MDEKRSRNFSNPEWPSRALFRPSITTVKFRGCHGESGYSLPLALVASFVLLIGVGALASRGNLGFIGQVVQNQNRQARDVAEAAIAEFGNSINQERNRHLLIAGTTANWNPATWTTPAKDFRNVCTVFDDNFVANETNGDPNFVNPDTNFVARFSAGGGERQLAPNDNARTFIVENVEFLNQSRGPYVDGSGSFLSFQNDPGNLSSTVSYGDLYRSGAQRSLIRITVRGSFNQNGRVSTARVAREFEVVPKCCKRSFGRNVISGTNWGRDEELCGSSLAGKLSGIIIGGNGGTVGGSNNPKPIVQEDGSQLTTAGCYSGPPEGGISSPLLGTSNPNCGGDPPISRGGISFAPQQINYSPPVYDNPNGSATGPNLNNLSSNTDNIIYFVPPDSSADFTNVNTPFSGVYIKRGTAAPTRLDGISPQTATAAQVDPCYVAQTFQPSSGKPYYTVNCKISGINANGGNRALYIDTSAAKFNIFTSGDVTLGGNASISNIRSYNRSDLTTPPSPSACVNNGNPSSCRVQWPNDPNSRLGTFLELCTDRGYACEKADDDELYSVRRLLNFYASGNQSFTLNGGTGGVGYNIYAPNGTVGFNGGGGNLNFMGQIFANNFNPAGNIQIQTFGGGAGTVTGGTTTGVAFGRALVDFVARSFTQSSGFGL
jgi:hypothetical protein